MKQKRFYEEARIDVVQLSSKAQLLAESDTTPDPTAPNLSMSRFSTGLGGGFNE